MSSLERPSFRDRRYAATVDEIKGVALRHYAEHGGSGLSLRAVARELGMSAQALYHYFAGRDELLNALVNDGYQAAADAVADGRDADATAPIIGASLGYRNWAVTQPHVFRLVYSDAITGYQPSAPTAGLAIRLGDEFAAACFPAWGPSDFAALGAALGELSDATSDATEPPWRGAAPVVKAHVAEWWAQVHGAVSLEVFGHLRWVGADPAVLYRGIVERLADRVTTVTSTARMLAADDDRSADPGTLTGAQEIS